MFRFLVSFAVISSLATLVAMSTLPELTPRAAGGYMQKPSGTASFTGYSGCDAPACGIVGTGFTAAMSQLSFGAAGGDGPGDACGRCFAITARQDPYSPWFAGPFTTIVVKVTNLCPGGPNNQWCGQTQANPTNAFGASVHFDLCEDTGAAAAFFPSGHGALTGSYTEVPCSKWYGTDESPIFNGACISGESAGRWPAVACGNRGTAP